jgi:hypothetical protein
VFVSSGYASFEPFLVSEGGFSAISLSLTGILGFDVGVNDVSLSTESKKGFERRLVVGQHGLVGSPLFSDIELASILDDYPDEKLHILTMGSDPTRSSDNEKISRRGASGSDLLESVRRGRLWLNITNIDSVDSRFRKLTDELYEGVGHEVPGFHAAETHATLLVSSPNAMVYYHVDGPPSFLWHVRGRKRVWVYPALEESLLERSLLEDVFAGVRQEYVPYSNDFDMRAEVIDLEPGQVAMWPQNAPHRVSNLDSFNVSLVTDHYTDAAKRRARLYRANRFLRAKAHVPHRLLSTKETGPGYAAKVGAHVVGRKLKLDDPIKKAHREPTRRVDPTSPDGLALIDSTTTTKTSA